MEADVTGKSQHDRKFFLWQMRAFFSMAILYLFYYFCKYNLGIATSGIREEFGFSRMRFGWIITVFTLTYAVGQFINGFLGDRYGPKLILIIGGLGGVAMNVCFGLSSGLIFFVIFWAFNAYFSSCGWAPGSRIMFNWFPEKKWGVWMGIYNALCYSGGFLVFVVATFAIDKWGWRSAFFVCPAFLLAMTIVFFFLGRNSPQEAGLQPPWEQKKEGKPAKRIGAEEYWFVFTHRKMNLAYLSGFGANFVRWGILTWMVTILEEPVDVGGFGLPLLAAGLITSFANLGGAFFSLLLGFVSDKVFKGVRWQTIFIGCILGGLPLFYIAKGAVILDYPAGLFLWGYPVSLYLLGLGMFLAGGLIQAVQTPLFALPGDILGKEFGGTGVGIMDGWMYLGASFAGVFFGWWLDSFGYTSGIMLMAVVSIVSGLLAIPIQK